MTNPDLLLLDEATEGLAPLIALEIWRICSLVAQSGISTVIVDKNWQHVTKVTQQNVILVKGEVVFQGPSAELLDEMLAAVANQRTSKSWVDGFVPHLSTWLNGKRWEDEPPRPAAIAAHETPRQAAARQWAQANSPLAAARAPNDPAPWDVNAQEPQRVIA
jgi:ABC-type multidrug transport system ATPase subunit